MLGLAGGLLGESLLLIQTHCAHAEEMLLEDFRVVAFLADEPEESRVRVVEERLRAMPGVEALRFVSAEESLADIQARDPELARSVALLGENPLTGAFEIQLSPAQLLRLPHWLREVESLPELGDIRYKPAQARAILQVQFYRRYLTLVLSMAGCLWLLAGARFLWVLGEPGRAGRTVSASAFSLYFYSAVGRELGQDVGLRCASAAVGTALGMGLAAGFAYPSSSLDLLSAWPPLGLQLCLLFSGALVGAMLSTSSRLSRPLGSRGKSSASREDEEPSKSDDEATRLAS